MLLMVIKVLVDSYIGCVNLVKRAPDLVEVTSKEEIRVVRNKARAVEFGIHNKGQPYILGNILRQ